MLVFMQRDLKAIQNDTFEEIAFDAFGFIKWLDWKIGGSLKFNKNIIHKLITNKSFDI